MIRGASGLIQDNQGIQLLPSVSLSNYPIQALLCTLMREAQLCNQFQCRNVFIEGDMLILPENIQLSNRMSWYLTGTNFTYS